MIYNCENSQTLWLITLQNCHWLIDIKKNPSVVVWLDHIDV